VRRSWRFMSACALLLAAASILMSAFLYTRIQGERERTIRANCQETNRRYDKAITTLDRLIAEAPPERRTRAREGRAGTVLLIDALVPKRDCMAVVKRSVGSPPPR
jgi:hypothetical protein